MSSIDGILRESGFTLIISVLIRSIYPVAGKHHI